MLPAIKKAGGQARMPLNVTGQPGLVIPADFSKDGLPLCQDNGAGERGRG